MAFFPRHVADSNSSFHPLFRLLDEFDKYSGERNERNESGSRGQAGHSQLSLWQPRFDVRETSNAYELYGELPGVSKENVSIDFPEPQHIVIRGSVKRSYNNGANPDDGSSKNAATEDKNQQSGDKDNIVVRSQQSADKAKFWLSERVFGDFSRSFNFPTAVDVEAVKASLQDGILSITVPKAKKPEVRRVTIN